VYPYSRKISSENIALNPLEEYAKDIVSHLSSAYVKICNQFNDIFGLLLGLLIIIIFILIDPEDFYSIESIVSVFAAYFIGKELWDDIEKILINISKDWRIRYTDNYYLYQLEKHTTLTQFSYFAKKCRYGKAPLLPEKMDFVQQSNSQTVRMFFDMRDLSHIEDDTAHILSIHIAPELLDDFMRDGFMLSIKLSLNKSFLGFVSSFEIFQSLSKNSLGCLDTNGNWHDNAALVRRTFRIKRLKYFKSVKVMPDTAFIDVEI